jgi:hypothetical protein
LQWGFERSNFSFAIKVQNPFRSSTSRCDLGAPAFRLQPQKNQFSVLSRQFSVFSLRPPSGTDN